MNLALLLLVQLRYSYEEYLGFIEYHNIITRMMAHNSFPYRNISVGPEDMLAAKRRLDRFVVIGIQDAFEASGDFSRCRFKCATVDFLLLE